MSLVSNDFLCAIPEIGLFYFATFCAVNGIPVFFHPFSYGIQALNVSFWNGTVRGGAYIQQEITSFGYNVNKIGYQSLRRFPYNSPALVSPTVVQRHASFPIRTVQLFFCWYCLLRSFIISRNVFFISYQSVIGYDMRIFFYYLIYFSCESGWSTGSVPPHDSDITVILE